LQIDDLKASRWPQRRRELDDSGFRVCGLASSVRFDYADAGERDRQVGIGRAYVDMTRALGGEFVRVFGDVLPEPAQADERQTVLGWISDGLQQLGEYAEDQAISILLETHGDFADSRLVAQTLSRVESPAVGVVWDTHHPWRFCGEPLVESFDRLRRWTRHTHWKDSVTIPETPAAGQSAADLAHQLMSGHRHADYVLFPGGEFPAIECMRLLLAAGYDGWHSLEWEKMWHPDLFGPEIALPLFPPKLRAIAALAGLSPGVAGQAVFNPS
jgi:sugar phosphate isomerase/epimerase